MTASTTHAPGQTAPKILPLTSARFFAALFVVFYHGWPPVSSSAGQRDLFSRIMSFGYVSVSFFFMLSGFILAIVYLKAGKPINRRRFFLSRFARIYPLYLAAVLLDLPHFLHTEHTFVHRGAGAVIATIVATITLVQAWFPNLDGLDPPSWSLSAEAFFYLLFPFVGALFWRMRLRSLMLCSVPVYLCGLWLVRSLHADGQSYVPLPHLFVFFLGIMLARLYFWILADSRRRMGLDRAAPWMVAASLIAFLSIPVRQIPVSESLLQHGLLAPLFALVILAGASGNVLIERLLSPNWLVVLGEASFALYLLHLPVREMLRRPIVQYGTPMFLVYVLLSVTLSVLSLKFLETPSRLWILEREKVRSRETTVSSALMQ